MNMYRLSSTTTRYPTAAHQPYQVQWRHFYLRAPTSVTTCAPPSVSSCPSSVTTFYHPPLAPHFFVPLVFSCVTTPMLPLPWPRQPAPPKLARTRLATKREPKHRRCFGENAWKCIVKNAGYLGQPPSEATAWFSTDSAGASRQKVDKARVYRIGLPELQSGLRFQEGLQLITINWKHHSLEDRVHESMACLHETWAKMWQNPLKQWLKTGVQNHQLIAHCDRMV